MREVVGDVKAENHHPVLSSNGPVAALSQADLYFHVPSGFE